MNVRRTREDEVRSSFMRRALRRRLISTILVAPAGALLLGVGTAHAATLSVAPTPVAPGADVFVSGNDWVGDVVIVFIQGQLAIQAGTAQTGPNGGPISITVPAPQETGTWQVCANSVQQPLPDPVCADLNVEIPTQPTNAPPTTVNQAPTTTPANANSTLPTDSSSPDTEPSDESSTTSIVALAPPVFPVEPDGISDVDEESRSTSGSGLSGLTIGLVAGIVALTGVGVVGLAVSREGHRPRRRAAIGVGLVGGILAGATAIAMPPPKVNIPKLSLSRVQVTEEVLRDAKKTVTAECPDDTVIVGGGWSSDWSSTRVDDVAPLVAWMDRQPNYVLRPPATTNSMATFASVETDAPFVDRSLLTQVNSDFWLFARGDGSVHASDSVWPSGNRSWKSLYDFNNWLVQQEEAIDNGNPVPPKPEVMDLPWSEDIRKAFVSLYYTWMDRAPSGVFADTRLVGTLVNESMPFEHGWRVTVSLPSWSLQKSLALSVVALCAPLAASVDEPGVLGVALRSMKGTEMLIARCKAGERLSSIGFDAGEMRGIVSAIPTKDLAGSEFTVINRTGGSLTSVCVRSDGLETTSVTSMTNVSGGYDDGTTASCPSGFSALGAGAQFVYKELGSGRLASATAVSSLNIIGPKDVNVAFRSPNINFPRNPSGPLLLDIPRMVGVYPRTAYATSDITEVTVHAICARRVLAMPAES